MISCREFEKRSSALLDRELPWRQRVEVWLHLLVCVYCRRYLRQLRLVIAALRVTSTQKHTADETEAQTVESLLAVRGKKAPEEDAPPRT
jgi:putative zinc finger protein